jgi:hypothetical protein
MCVPRRLCMGISCKWQTSKAASYISRACSGTFRLRNAYGPRISCILCYDIVLCGQHNFAQVDIDLREDVTIARQSQTTSCKRSQPTAAVLSAASAVIVWFNSPSPAPHTAPPPPAPVVESGMVRIAGRYRNGSRQPANGPMSLPPADRAASGRGVPMKGTIRVLTR